MSRRFLNYKCTYVYI